MKLHEALSYNKPIRRKGEEWSKLNSPHGITFYKSDFLTDDWEVDLGNIFFVKYKIGESIVLSNGRYASLNDFFKNVFDKNLPKEYMGSDFYPGVMFMNGLKFSDFHLVNEKDI